MLREDEYTGKDISHDTGMIPVKGGSKGRKEDRKEGRNNEGMFRVQCSYNTVLARLWRVFKSKRLMRGIMHLTGMGLS